MMVRLNESICKESVNERKQAKVICLYDIHMARHRLMNVKEFS